VIPAALAPEITSTLRTIADAIERGDAGAETALCELGRSIQAATNDPAPALVSAVIAAADDWTRGLKACKHGDVLAVRNIQRVEWAVDTYRAALAKAER
jgi:hypothetical protein